MKKVLFLFMLVFTLAGCSNDEEEKNSLQTVMLNVYYKYENSSDKEIANPTLVYLYDYDEANGFDKTKSITSMANDRKLTMPDGTYPTPRYTSNSYTGINTIENVTSGKYIVTAFYKPDGYSFPMLYYYGYKILDLTENQPLSSQNLIFTWGTDYSGRFIEFN